MRKSQTLPVVSALNWNSVAVLGFWAVRDRSSSSALHRTRSRPAPPAQPGTAGSFSVGAHPVMFQDQQPAAATPAEARRHLCTHTLHSRLAVDRLGIMSGSFPARLTKKDDQMLRNGPSHPFPLHSADSNIPVLEPSHTPQPALYSHKPIRLKR